MKGFYQTRNQIDYQRVHAKIADDVTNTSFVRTGDVGFLYNVTRSHGHGGAPIQMQTLFVLGCLGETIEINGLLHFPIDIERTIEASHRYVFKCAIFQAGGQTVAVLEVSEKAQYLAAIVPVVVNAVLSEHQIVLELVAFVCKGDFPRSRLGEKQRGRILSGWITRKL